MYSSECGEAGGNYGWPHYEGASGDPNYIDHVQHRTPAEASPSAIEIHNDTIYMVALRRQRLWEIPLVNHDTSTEHLVGEFVRLRDFTTAPDGSLWLLANNTDGVGTPSEHEELLLRVETL